MTDRVKVASTVTQTENAILVDGSTQTDPTEADKVVGAAAAAKAANVNASAQSAASITSKASTDAPGAAAAAKVAKADASAKQAARLAFLLAHATKKDYPR